MSKWMLGGGVDERSPEIDDLIGGLDLDSKKFAQWLGPELGRIGFESEYKLPSASTERRELKSFLKSLHKTIGFLQTGGLPPSTTAHMAQLAHKAGMNIYEEKKRLLPTLYKIKTLAKSAQTDMEKWFSPTDRARMVQRDNLLAAIVTKLTKGGATKVGARHIAEQILTRSGIQTPTSERAVRRAENRSKQDTSK